MYCWSTKSVGFDTGMSIESRFDVLADQIDPALQSRQPLFHPQKSSEAPPLTKVGLLHHEGVIARALR